MATKQALLAEVSTNFADNTTGAITPAITRTTHNDEINSWQQAPQVNTQLGTTYTLLTSDYGQVVLFNNASPVAVSLPTPATTGFTPFNSLLKNNGVGNVTVTPLPPSTLDGAASLVLGSGQSAWVISDGTNWRTGIVAGAPQVLSVNTTPVSGGVSGNFFYNNGGVFAERNAAAATAALNTFTPTLQGLVPASTMASTTNFLRADGAWAAPSAGGGALTVGTTAIGSGTSGRVLFDSAGILGEYAISGTGNVAMTTSPTFTTPVLGIPTSGTLTNCTGLPASGITGQITLVQLPTLAANTVLGSIAGGTPIGLTATQLTTLINTFTTALSGAVPASGGGTVNFLRADGTWIAPPTGGAAASIAVGSTTVTGGASLEVLYNNAGLLGVYTNAQLTALIQLFTNTLSGAVPASGGGTVNFLRADGTWSTPPGGAAGSLTVGVTTIGSGATTRVLFDNAGTLGEYTVSGTGSVAMTTSPVFTTPNIDTATASSINKVVITAPATGATLTIADGKTLTANNSLTFTGTDGTTMTFPAANANVAALNIADQTVTGGANVTSLSLASGSFTVDCGARPLQSISNNATFTITAPANDGSCILLVTNVAGAGSINFTGFSVGANVGDTLTTIVGNKFSIFIWRVAGTSGYRIAAHQ
jgi:hypothetical protein